MADVDPQEFGRLQSEVVALRRDNDRMLELLGKLTTTVDSINEKLSEAKGGWKLLMLLGGAAATLGGLLAWAVQHVNWR
jgi:hypothetical protein